MHYSGRALVYGPYAALVHGPYLPCEGLPKTSSVKGGQLTSRNFPPGQSGLSMVGSYIGHGGHYNIVRGSYYNAPLLHGPKRLLYVFFDWRFRYFPFLFLSWHFALSMWWCHAIFMVPCGYGIFPRFHFAFGSIAKLGVKEPSIAFWAWGHSEWMNEWRRVCQSGVHRINTTIIRMGIANNVEVTLPNTYTLIVHRLLSLSWIFHLSPIGKKKK